MAVTLPNAIHNRQILLPVKPKHSNKHVFTLPPPSSIVDYSSFSTFISSAEINSISNTDAGVTLSVATNSKSTDKEDALINSTLPEIKFTAAKIADEISVSTLKTNDWITTSHFEGTPLWSNYSNASDIDPKDLDLVLASPNEWTGSLVAEYLSRLIFGILMVRVFFFFFFFFLMYYSFVVGDFGDTRCGHFWFLCVFRGYTMLKQSYEASVFHKCISLIFLLQVYSKRLY